MKVGRFIVEIKLKTTINQQLPILTNEHLNNWTKLLTERTFVMWLKLMVQAEQNSHYSSINELANLYQMTVEKFEKEIIASLFEVGLLEIDYIKADRKTIKGITIYPFPYNDSKKIVNLKKTRQYRMDYVPFIKQSDKPLKLLDVLTKHHQKLWNDNIDKEILMILLGEEKDSLYPLSENEFARLIDNVLTKSKTRIASKGNAYGYFKAIIRKHKENLIKK